MLATIEQYGTGSRIAIAAEKFHCSRLGCAALSLVAGKCRLPDLNGGQLDLQSSALPV